MASITLRSVKGTPLTNTEVDNNFSNINTELGQKVDLSTSQSIAGDKTFTGITTLDNYLRRTTANGISTWLQQDGTGRSHWYWNTVGGVSPTFTNAGEDASSISLTVTNNGAGGIFQHRSASGVGKLAGDAIAWVTTIYSDLNTFTWKGNTILRSDNYNSYSPTLTGTGASGTWGISITGNAATVTDGVYLSGTQTITGNKTFSGSVAFSNTINGSISGNAATVGTLGLPSTVVNNEANKIVRTDGSGYIQAGWINTISGDNGTATMDRVYASSDGYIRYYTPANFRTVLDVPTRGGSGASGTWGINISGNAATVTNGIYTTNIGTYAYTPSTFSYSSNVAANHVVQRDSNGYIYANYINFNHGTDAGTIANCFYDNGDGWLRKTTKAHFISQLNITGTPALNIVTGATQTAVAGNHYVLTNAAVSTLTLPASPSAGDVVWVGVGNNRADNIIARNGQNIMGLAEDMTIDNVNATVQLRFANSTLGWRII